MMDIITDLANNEELLKCAVKLYGMKNVDGLSLEGIFRRMVAKDGGQLLLDYKRFICRQNQKTKADAVRNQEIKADGGKLRLELIPTSAITSLGRVLTYGAKKYSADSWKNVERERYVGAILRHLIAYIDDPDGVDEESGLKHIEHVLCNAAFLNDMATHDVR